MFHSGSIRGNYRTGASSGYERLNAHVWHVWVKHRRDGAATVDSRQHWVGRRGGRAVPFSQRWPDAERGHAAEAEAAGAAGLHGGASAVLRVECADGRGGKAVVPPRCRVRKTSL